EQDDAARLLGQGADHRGQSEVVDRLDAERDHAADDRDRAALPEGIDAEAGDAGDRVGEIDLAPLLELGQLLLVGHRLQGALGLLRVSGSEPSIGPRAPCTRTIAGDATLTCRSEPSSSTTRRRAESISNIVSV